MKFSSAIDENQDMIINMFEESFTASEGREEGKLIGALVKELIDTTPSQELFSFFAWEECELIGGIFFSRFRFQQDERMAFLLSPVAVLPNQQNKGVGQALLNYGLNVLRDKKIDLAITYGDPEYYCQVGFEQISEKIIRAPHPLSQPDGWLAQSLSVRPIVPSQGKTSCAEAFNDPAYW